LREKHDLDFSVVFTGADHGNKKYIQEKVSELGLTNKVFFLGLVSFEVLSWLYKKAFALIYPTFFGPENLPPLEAFAFGCPVIASNVPGSEEQLGDAAILINPINEEEIANAVRKLYDDPALRQTLIKRGQARVSKLQENNFVDRMMLILDQFEPIRRCWTNKEIYKYPVPTETIDEDDILSHSSDDQPATAPLNEEQHSLQTLAEAIENINNLLESNNLEDANNGLKQAIEKFPDSPDLFSLHAIYKLRMKDSEGAKGILFDLIKNHPAYYPAYVNIASIFSKNGDYESASKYFEEALKLDKNNRESVYEYGSMLMSSKKYAKAKEIFETYLRNNPGDSEIRLHLQKCEGILGKVSNLKQVIEKAM
jgi:tetratricopeptide (TPR) repeat protein